MSCFENANALAGPPGSSGCREGAGQVECKSILGAVNGQALQRGEERVLDASTTDDQP